MANTPFLADIFVPTRDSAASRDKDTPHLGSLSAGGMIDDGGLSGTSGHETVIIKGDRFQRLTGKETIYRKGDVLDDTIGDWTGKVKGNVNEKITQNFTWLVNGQVVQTHKGETRQTFVGAVAQVFDGSKHAQESIEWLHWVPEIFSYGIFHSDNFFAYTMAAIFSVSGFATNLDLRGVDVGFKALHGEKVGVELWEKEEKADVTLMMQRVRVTESFVMAVEPGVGAAMMHEVAVTQEIFAVGANQAL